MSQMKLYYKYCDLVKALNVHDPKQISEILNVNLSLVKSWSRRKFVPLYTFVYLDSQGKSFRRRRFVDIQAVMKESTSPPENTYPRRVGE